MGVGGVAIEPGISSTGQGDLEIRGSAARFWCAASNQMLMSGAKDIAVITRALDTSSSRRLTVIFLGTATSSQP